MTKSSSSTGAPDLRSLDSVRLLGVRIHTLSVQSLLDLTEKIILSNKKTIIANVNVNAMNLAYTQPRFRKFLDNADVVFCDGHGVRLGAILAGLNIPHRYTIPDWIDLLASMCVRHELSMYFLGARPGIAADAAKKLYGQVPGVRIVGTDHGYFDKTPGSEENEFIIQNINRVNPNILLVGFGMPCQELWLLENWRRIRANVAFPVGALFDYMTGRLYRPPRWITDNGFEWLSRLIVEPCRLWKRYLLGNPMFFWRILKAVIH